MSGVLWQQRLRPWFTRRWYRPLIALVVPSAFLIPVGMILLAVLPHADFPLRISPLSGVTCALGFSFAQFAIAMTATMRCPQPLRLAMVLSIVALTTVFIWYTPIGGRIKIPLAFAVYCSCIGSLLVGIVFRLLSGQGLVGSGGYSLGSSLPISDLWLLAVIGIFFWLHYEEHYTRRLVRYLGSGYLWACVAAGAATGWCFLARCRFRSRLLGYSIAFPGVLLALWKVSVASNEYMYSPVSWSIIVVVAVAAFIGWIVAQEAGAYLLDVCHWKWRELDRLDKVAMSDMFSEVRPVPASLRNVWLFRNGSHCLVRLFLVSVLLVLLITLAETSVSLRPFERLLVFLIPVAAACVISFFVLAAHQVQRLWALCLMLAVFLLVLASLPPEIMVESPMYFRYGILAFPIPIAAAVYMVIRLTEQRGRQTIGSVKRVREPISIQELMGGTLIVGIEFSMLRVAQVDVLQLVALLGVALFFCVLSLMIYRVLFIGFTRGTWIAVGGFVAMYLAGASFEQGLRSPTMLIGLVLYIGCHWIIAASFRRSGWTGIPV